MTQRKDGGCLPLMSLMPYFTANSAPMTHIASMTSSVNWGENADSTIGANYPSVGCVGTDRAGWSSRLRPQHRAATGEFDDPLIAIKCPHCGDEDLYRWSARSEMKYTPKSPAT